jgi:dipeptidyl aminopeptidase/acylaminoacyl peptidase
MAHDVARYLGIDSVDSPSFTVDGDLLCLADTTGTPQVWRVDEADTWPERLTPYEERVSTVAASPERPEFVFGMDRGSDEHDQLYRYDLGSGEITQLTDDPDASHEWGAWSPDGDRIAFAANRTDTGRFDVHVQGRDERATESERVFEGDGGFLSVAAWGPDGRRLALLEPHSSFDVDLHVLDLERDVVRTFGDDEPATFHDVHFDSRGSTLYLVTDYGHDTSYVGRVDLDTGEIGVLTDGSTRADADPGDWDVDHLAVHRPTERLVYSRNVDGFAELHAGYLNEGELVENAAPNPADGVVSEIAFGPGGHRYAFGYSDRSTPAGVHVAAFGTESDERWTPAGTCGIPEERFRDPSLVHYETFDGREIPAYWTLPAEPAVGETPVIVDIHGGPEHQRRPWFYPEQQFFLDHGFAVLEPNVRGSTGYGREYASLDDVENRMDSVKDVRAAVEWAHDQEFVDPEKVVAYGRSYGGFMVLSAITQYPDLWAAAVEFVGIADFVTFLENTGDWRRSHRESEYGSLEHDREFLESISPIHDAGSIECPLFVQHGANDPRVPVGESEQIAASLEERGVPVETCIFEDEGHHTTSRANRIEQFERIAAFLDEHV